MSPPTYIMKKVMQSAFGDAVVELMAAGYCLPDAMKLAFAVALLGTYCDFQD